MRLDVDALTRAVGAALPEATPDAAAQTLLAQIPHLDAPTGVSLVDRITAKLPASTWDFEDQRLDRWPKPVAERAMAHVRSLPPGKRRILALCCAAKRLTLDERREALDGILDRTLPATDWEYTKPISHRTTIASLIRTLPEDWQEEWIAHRSLDDRGKPDVSSEYRARHEVDRLTETAIRQLWARIDHTPAPHRDVPYEYVGLAGHLPEDLRQQALTRIRASASRDTRLRNLRHFDEQLTDAERCELVEIPQSFDTRSQAIHLQLVRQHLSRVPVALQRECLDVVLSFDDDDPHALQHGLMALLPCLSGADLRRCVDALVASVITEGGFYTSETRWDLLPDETLAPLLLRLEDDLYGWSRDQLIEHVIAARDPTLADRCSQPLLDALAGRAPDARLEIVAAMTPWLAERSEGAAPRSLAQLAVPSPSRPSNPLYVVERVLEASKNRVGEPEAE